MKHVELYIYLVAFFFTMAGAFLCVFFVRPVVKGSPGQLAVQVMRHIVLAVIGFVVFHAVVRTLIIGQPWW